MALISNFNFRDPRFQRALLAEKASRPYAALPVRGAATRAFIQQDLRNRLAFGNLGLRQRAFENQMKFNRARLRMQEQALQSRQEQLPWTIGIGGLTSLLGLFEGRRQRKELKKTNKLAAKRDAARLAAIKEQTEILRRGL